MKHFLIIFFALSSFLSFAQTQQRKLDDSITVKIPLDKQISPSKLRDVLKAINNKTQITAIEPLVNPNPYFVDKGNDNSYPYDQTGGINTAFKFRVWRTRNITSFDFVVSKNADMSNPTHSFNSTFSNAQIVGLDSSEVYYWKYRGKNVNFTGAWSNIKRFDTYALPLGFPLGRYKSIFDLEEYVPFVTRIYPYQWLIDNMDYPYSYRIGTKQMFNRHVKGTVTTFPYTVLTGISQIISTYETACGTSYSWGKQPDYIDINSYLSLSGSTLVLAQPPTTYPISQIDFFVNIFYLK